MSIQQRSKITGIGQRTNEKLIVLDVNDVVTELNNLPDPVTTNPGSGIYPINKDGVFVDSGLRNIVEDLPEGPFNYLGLKYYDDFIGLTLLELNPLDLAYTFGDAFYDEFGVVANSGIAISSFYGAMVIGCGISSGENGVFKADGNTGLVTMGNTPSTSIGVFFYDDAIVVGSSFNYLIGPSNTSNPVRWTKVVDDNFMTYWYPMYQ